MFGFSIMVVWKLLDLTVGREFKVYNVERRRW